VRTETGLLSVALARLKRPQTLAAAVLLAATAGLAANALLLQGHRHPAPFFSTRDVVAEPEPAQPSELVRTVQDALKQIGYYAGPLDGVPGPQTRLAILAFEAEAGLPENGEATAELLAAARAAGRPDQTTTAAIPQVPTEHGAEGAAPPETAEPDPLVSAIQNALARAAYGPLDADGVAGPATRDAIKRFQRDHNLPITGEITDALVVELRASGAFDGG
jgi:peptidoglycan hydrolase-like protein with peptidoglycan-binding domain